jgi:tetratricopeptide (TPR) repeat protein
MNIRAAKNNYFKMGVKLSQAGKHLEAIEAFKLCDEPYLTYIAAQCKIAGCWSKLGHYDESHSILESLLKVFNEDCNYESYSRLELTLEECTDFNEKIIIEQKLKQLKKEISHKEIVFTQMANDAGYLYRKTKEKVYLIKLKDAIDKHPNQSNRHVQRNLAAYYSYIEEFDKALIIINELLKNTYTSNFESSLILMKAKIVDGQSRISGKCNLTEEEAIKLLEVPGPNIHALLRVAHVYPHLINLEKTPIKPTYTIEDYKIAEIFWRLGMYKEAEAEYVTFLEKNPNHWQTRIEFAYFLTKIEDYEKAIEILLPAVQHDVKPKPQVSVLLNAYKALSLCYRELTDTKNAIIYVNRGLAINPNEASLLSTKAKLLPDYSINSKFDLFERAKNANPNRFEAHHPLPVGIQSKVFVENKKIPTTHDNNISKDHVPNNDTYATIQTTLNYLESSKKKKEQSTNNLETPTYENIEFVPSLKATTTPLSNTEEKNVSVNSVIEKKIPAKSAHTKNKVRVKPAHNENTASAKPTPNKFSVKPDNESKVPAPDRIENIVAPKIDEKHMRHLINESKKNKTSSWCNLFTRVAAVVATATVVAGLIKSF